MTRLDLNQLEQRYVDFDHDRPKAIALPDNSVCVSHNVELEAFFKNLEGAAVDRIAEADAVVGCVAWLTSPAIIDALAGRPHGVSILVQKEDFLRPDLGDTDGFAGRLQTRYSKLRSIHGPVDGWHEHRNAEVGGSRHLDFSARCVGYARSADEITLPRMHHKFLVFCKYLGNSEHENFWPYEPYAVWTGSFNMTFNGSKSLENAVYIREANIAKAYFSEWQSLLMVSESLDWTTNYASPDIQFNDGSIYS